MSNKIQLLDCTLRDGSYIVEGNFGNQVIKGLVQRLTKAHVDIIECGWLKDCERKEGSSYFHQPSDAEPFIDSSNRNAIYVAMIDYNRYNIDALEPYNGKGIEAIRIVFPKDHVDDGLALVPKIQNKGYRVMVQAANTFGYSDMELIQLAVKVNQVHPFALSIVDTFGTMYREDLVRIMSILDNNLGSDIKVGFHSHNNQQMSFSLAQDFVDCSVKKEREIIVDASLCGMGRGAGNANTELVVSFLNKKYHKDYDLDLILDTIDIYMVRFLKNYQWGYSVPLFVAGINCTHVNNIKYLQDTHYAKSRDISNTLELLPASDRTAYDYGKLESAYMNYVKADIKDDAVIDKLKENFSLRKVLLIAPGKRAVDESDKINQYIRENSPIIIGINWMPEIYDCDYVFFSNRRRYEYSREKNREKFDNQNKIILSNLNISSKKNTLTVNYNRLLRRNWKHYENSLFLCLRLLNQLDVTDIAIAGFDGLGAGGNYSDENYESMFTEEERKEFNKELVEMMEDYLRISKERVSVTFVTKSIVES